MLWKWHIIKSPMSSHCVRFMKIEFIFIRDSERYLNMYLSIYTVEAVAADALVTQGAVVSRVVILTEYDMSDRDAARWRLISYNCGQLSHNTTLLWLIPCLHVQYFAISSQQCRFYLTITRFYMCFQKYFLSSCSCMKITFLKQHSVQISPKLAHQDLRNTSLFWS